MDTLRAAIRPAYLVGALQRSVSLMNGKLWIGDELELAAHHHFVPSSGGV